METKTGIWKKEDNLEKNDYRYLWRAFHIPSKEEHSMTGSIQRSFAFLIVRETRKGKWEAEFYYAEATTSMKLISGVSRIKALNFAKNFIHIMGGLDD